MASKLAFQLTFQVFKFSFLCLRDQIKFGTRYIAVYVASFTFCMFLGFFLSPLVLIL